MTIKELTALLRTLRKHGVTSYEDGAGLKIGLTWEACEPWEQGRLRKNAPGAQANAEIGPGDLPMLDEADGDPRSFLGDLQQLAQKNDPRLAELAAKRVRPGDLPMHGPKGEVS